MTRRLAAGVLIVGGGPAGLTAAADLAPPVDGEVLVLDREAAAGGIPRHSDHPGYGIRDLHRFLSGPAYARRLVARAPGAPARRSAPRRWSPAGPATRRARRSPRPPGRSSSSRGRGRAGHRRPRTAPRGPADPRRPARRRLHHRAAAEPRAPAPRARSARRAVVVGAELVSWSAVLTLREAGCRPSLMTTEYPTGRSPTPRSRWPGGRRCACRSPPAPAWSRIIGRGRVEAVEIEDLDTGRAPDRRLRHRRLHRRLDPRPRAGPRRRARHRPGGENTGGGHAADQPARHLRRRQCGAPSRAHGGLCALDGRRLGRRLLTTVAAAADG